MHPKYSKREIIIGRIIRILMTWEKCSKHYNVTQYQLCIVSRSTHGMTNLLQNLRYPFMKVN